MLPGYGAGFISACLDACGGDPERVVHQLLEGSLPPELAALDPNMPAAPPPPRVEPTAPAAAAGMSVPWLMPLPSCKPVLSPNWFKKRLCLYSATLTCAALPPQRSGTCEQAVGGMRGRRTGAVLARCRRRGRRPRFCGARVQRAPAGDGGAAVAPRAAGAARSCSLG